MALASCGGAGAGSAPGTSSPARPLPTAPAAFASQLSRADAEAKAEAAAWRGSGATAEPPADLVAWARYHQRLIVALAERPRLAANVVPTLRPAVRGTTADLSAAVRELDRLSRGEPSVKLRIERPAPIADLLRYYRAAERRFGVAWRVLAAINMVESAFGRVRSPSSAGAQGPMQFLPATWREYGLGGDVRDPHDAILGAANYLSATGAPADYRGALQSYNPSLLYARAVLHISRALARDPSLVYVLYAWRP